MEGGWSQYSPPVQLGLQRAEGYLKIISWFKLSSKASTLSVQGRNMSLNKGGSMIGAGQYSAKSRGNCHLAL